MVTSAQVVKTLVSKTNFDTHTHVPLLPWATLGQILTIGRESKVAPPPGYKGGGRLMEPLPSIFAVFQYFAEILPLIEGL